MRFYCRASSTSGCIGVLSGSYNPPTRAHLALAEAALSKVDEVLFVLPRLFPHKSYDGVGFDQRLELMVKLVELNPRFSFAVSEGGLFIEIARECRQEYGDAANIAFVCGRDAAERVTAWNYEGQVSIEEQFREYSMLVAARQGTYIPPQHLKGYVDGLEMDDEFDWHSATEVRQRIMSGESWEHLIPTPIVKDVARFYGDRR